MFKNGIERPLSEKREEIQILAEELFKKIIGLDPKVRIDTKERKGVQVFCCVPGSRNLLILRVGEPSEAAQFFSIEKAVRTDLSDDMTSDESAEEKLCRFPGAVAFNGSKEENPDLWVIVSTSGLLGAEDSVISCIIQGKIWGISPREIIADLRGFRLSEGITQEGHYLNALIEEYS
ncbi:MAG: hypothetical protein LBO09_06155 [Candidatus Peribacteria bacterium]|jgi:hypothetical protein|nr:hypothetical protein [Candidatus Peribacteria bacterium]